MTDISNKYDSKDVEEFRSTRGWAEDFLNDVAQAREAVERADKLKEWRTALAHRLPAHVEPDTVEMVVAKDDAKTVHSWADDVLADFDEMAYVQRQCLGGQLLCGLDIAEAKYRLGLPNKQITHAFYIGNDTMYRRLKAFTDYLDYLGPERAFTTDVDERNDPPENVVFVDDELDDEAEGPFFTNVMPETTADSIEYLKQLAAEYAKADDQQ